METTSPRIVVVGSANVDMIVRSERLPRPGETVVGGAFQSAGGGKGANQAIAARRLGAEVVFVARLGDDGPGRELRVAFRREGVVDQAIIVDPDAATGVALILVDAAGQNMISVAPGANGQLRPADLTPLLSLCAGARALVTQLEIPLETVRAALELARSRGMLAILNPAPGRAVPDEILGLTDWLTPNESEAQSLTGVPVVDASSARVAAEILRSRGARNVVITLGKHGALYRGEAGTLAIPAFEVPTVDATAAGDAFTAGLAVALARGGSVANALTYASACGALATTRPGAQPSLPSHAEVAGLAGASDGG